MIICILGEDVKTFRLEAMEAQREGLSQEVQAMEPEERTRSLGVVWQYAGRGRGKMAPW